MPEQVAVAFQIVTGEVEFDDLEIVLAAPVEVKRHFPLT